MRDIIYRGKLKDNGEWIYGYYLEEYRKDKTKKSCIFRSWTDGEKVFNHKEMVTPETVGQYTGLTDKNGNKIFEGDIVKSKHTIRLSKTKEEILTIKKPRRAYGLQAVEADFKLFSLGNECNLYDVIYYRNYIVKSDIIAQRTKIQNGSDFHFLAASYVYYHDIEIIGNIHDTPELLKEYEK